MSLLSFEHPTVSKFVEGLLKQLSLTTFQLELLNSSNIPPPNVTVVKQAARLKTAVNSYG
jgi:hypothetical protein